MKSTKYLFEDLGSLTRRDYENESAGTPSIVRPPNQRLARHQNRTYNVIRATGNELQGVKLFDFSFRPWQQSLINTLQGGTNVYQVASPGAGKTAPVVFHWAHILGLNPDMVLNTANFNNNAVAVAQVNELITNLLRFFNFPRGALGQIPKLLYLCPVRQLVYEVRKDFTMHVSKILYHLIHITIAVHNDRRLTNNPSLFNSINMSLNGENELFSILARNGMNVQPLVRRKQVMHDEMTRVMRLQVNDSRANKLAKDIQVVDQQIMKIIVDGMKRFISTNIVNIKSEQDSITNYDAPIIITIYQSANGVYKKINTNRLRMIVLDEAHLTQQISPTDSQAKDITTSLYSILKKFSGLQQCQLVLLSGTVNPQSATNLIQFLNRSMNIPITRLESGSEARNPSNISVMPMDSLNNDDTLVKLMLKPPENNNVIILFSKKRIKRLVKQALQQTKGHQHTADQIERGDLQKRQRSSLNINLQDLEKDHPENVRDGFNLNRNQFLDAVNKMPEANEIYNPDLLQCVLSGFGYIYRAEDDSSAEIKSHAGQDSQIVANLFSQGKIKTLLATDAVGIGINLTIKNMYVPESKKFSDGSFVNLPLSNASQLYNRTGRMAFTTSSIYTPQENVNSVIQAISATNNSFDMRETLGRFKQLVSPTGGAVTFANAWRSFSNYIR